jgi:hypothetical protein
MFLALARVVGSRERRKPVLGFVGEREVRGRAFVSLRWQTEERSLALSSLFSLSPLLSSSLTPPSPAGNTTPPPDHKPQTGTLIGTISSLKTHAPHAMPPPSAMLAGPSGRSACCSTRPTTIARALQPGRAVAPGHRDPRDDRDDPQQLAAHPAAALPPTTASRRHAALATAAVLVSLAARPPAPSHALPARSPADAKAVGSYLPPAPANLNLPEGWVYYVPDARTTPATRAGVIKANPDWYQFALSPGMKPVPIVNALTGGFCFPNCVEPWYEAVFSDPDVGKVFLCAIIIQKLLPSAKADGTDGKNVTDLGTPESVARAVGPLISGEGYEDEDFLVGAEREAEAAGGGQKQIFYDIEMNAAVADKAGPRRLAAVTVKSGIVYLFVGAATDRQWTKGGEEALRAMVKSFRA